VVSSFILLVLLIGVFSVVVPETVRAFQDGDYIYETTGDPLVATITGYAGEGGAIIIPSTVGGYPTVHIGNGAFESCSSLTSVTIPDTVTTIGDFAFISCGSLASVIIGSSLTTIGSYAFDACNHLTSIAIPDSVTTIGAYAFYKCTNLTSVTLGDGVVTIGNYAFSYCTQLPSVMIPSSVTNIGTYVFQYCTSLTTITVDESNVQYASINGVLYTKDITTLIQCPAHKTEPVIIPDSVDTIGKAAFFACTSLSSISIPSSVDSIGDYAFSHCPLTTVDIPNSVITIGVYTFAFCPLISVTIGSKVNAIGNYAFTSCNSLTSITFFGLVAPSYVGTYWILNTPNTLRGHASAASTFPEPGGVWNGLTMGTYLSENGGSNGGSSSDENQKPVADTSAGEPYQGYVNSEIFFNGSASYDPDGNITTWLWDFGDNTNGTGKTVRHSYSKADTYIVTLTVIDNQGAITTRQTTAVILTVNTPPLQPMITGPSVGQKNVLYNYSVTAYDADNDTIQYTVVWGDQTSYANTSVFLPSGTPFLSVHSWTVAGRYNVTVAATDNISASSSHLTVYIDAVQTGEIGYLIDTDSNGIYDMFCSDESQQLTAVQQTNGAYTIDTDGDGSWDYTFDTSQGLTPYEESPQTPGFELIVVLSAIVFLVLVRRLDFRL